MTLELLIGAFGNQFAKNYLLPSSFSRSVRTCACPTAWEQRDCCHQTSVLEISCFELLQNCVNKIPFAFKVLTKTEHLTQTATRVRATRLYNTDTVLCEVRNELKEHLTI
jgi:hypothetical protein